MMDTKLNITSCREADTQQVPGMAYVPWQKWSEPFDSEKSLKEGTMFEDLNMKFERGAK